MANLDWIILFGTLAFIVIYGTWKSRGSQNIEGYLKGDNEMKWYTIGLSIMATQASAITFLSTPGQAFEDGMRFIQFYFGLPIAMIIISFTILPIYYKLKVYTAYEYLENRFDYKTRLLAAFLFLVQRGLAAGITIYAPAIILSSILGWNLNFTNIFIGFLVIIYTVAGGTKAVSQTQKQQMLVILAGMTIAFIIVVNSLPQHITFSNAVSIAGTMGKMNVVDFSFDFTTRYTFWSGITGGLFLAMSYFGTDQSQVQRYLSGKSLKESRLGLMFNGIVKIPMQFLILFTGIMVFVFYQFEQSPVFFNENLTQKVYNTPFEDEMREVEKAHASTFQYKKEQINQYVTALNSGNDLTAKEAANKIRIAGKLDQKLRKESQSIIKNAIPGSEAKDTDYIFISFIMKYLPTGIIGLLLAVIFSAAMSSTSGELNALASTTVIDIYKRRINPSGSDKHYLSASKWFTVFWGLIAILFATFASLVDNLIQAVNILGSIFYGTILGIFLSAFYIKIIKSKEVFIAAIITQVTVILLYLYSDIGFLWYNVIGCALVIGLALVLGWFYRLRST
ncbi:MAG: sodium:solute symporter [Bacteroidetes bacterium]|nr:sodium:solute symporter [Bacteroidota bacterium]HET6245689.1 sodium:solute symporter [Bacteroidia bacterium]